VITGLEEPADPDWPHDHELLALAAGCDPGEVGLIGYGPPVSPHLAAELSGRPIRSYELHERIAAAANGDRVLVVEGVGGLLVPLGDGYDVRDMAGELGLRLVVAARPGLGTINHTLLTLEAARRAGLDVAGVVLTPWPEAPGEVERSNRTTIERLGAVAVSTLPPIPRAEPEHLAAAGGSLPLGDWIGSDRARE
jgi:dethiobiotin synthetase